MLTRVSIVFHARGHCHGFTATTDEAVNMTRFEAYGYLVAAEEKAETYYLVAKTM